MIAAVSNGRGCFAARGACVHQEFDRELHGILVLGIGDEHVPKEIRQ